MGEKFKEYKVCFLGDAGVGKTSILSKYIRGRIDMDVCATIGASFQVCKMNNIHGEQIKLMIWDTAGQERYRSMIQIYTRGCRVFIIVYDLSEQSSFEAIKNFWLDYASKNIVKDEQNKIIHSEADIISKGTPDSTNNYGELTAIMASLNWLLRAKPKPTVIHSDSNLAINLCNKIWTCRNERLQPILNLIHRAQAIYKQSIQYVWISRDKNEEADQLSRTPYTPEVVNSFRSQQLDILFQGDNLLW